MATTFHAANLWDALERAIDEGRIKVFAVDEDGGYVDANIDTAEGLQKCLEDPDFFV